MIGTEKVVGTSNINMNSLEYSLSMFKAIKYLEVGTCIYLNSQVIIYNSNNVHCGGVQNLSPSLYQTYQCFADCVGIFIIFGIINRGSPFATQEGRSLLWHIQSLNKTCNLLSLDMVMGVGFTML